MASNSNGNDKFVVLKCIDSNCTEPETTDHGDGSIVISAAEISSWDLSSILAHQIVKIKADRNRLIEQSSYFHGLLSGSFSESCFTCTFIHWNLETFLSLLKFIYGYPVDVASNNFLPLFKAALFFGVDKLLLECKTWLTEATLNMGIPSLRLNDLIHIWNFGVDHANDFIPERCAYYLAKNFMWAISCNSFGDIPYNLLLSCIKHPHLTVHSERHLSDAILVWLDLNKEENAKDDCIEILKKIRISLLPLWFATGKRSRCYFSKFSDESIQAIVSLTILPSTSSINIFGDGDLRHLRIRLTEYTKQLDLSGCPQMIPAILLLSLLPCSYSMDPTLRNSITKSSVNHEVLHQDKFQIQYWFPLLSTFEAVQKVDISNCPKLHLEAATECFYKSFPSLQILKAAHFLNFRIQKLGQLVQRCPLLRDIDLTVDISPVIPTQVSIVSSQTAKVPQTSTVSYRSNYPSAASLSSSSRSLPSNITTLTLEGRIDVTDSDLHNISELCVSLRYLNIRGCTSVSDGGISLIILKCVKLHSLVVCDTSFGQKSILSLCFCIPDSNKAAAPQVAKKNSMSLAYKLQKLHMGGCRGASETHLSELMSQTHKLSSLCLRGTQLDDSAIYSFFGSSLEMLDVSSTKVSAAALAHIVGKSPSLKRLGARDCKNLFQPESKSDDGRSYSCNDLYFKLGRSCQLEDIAVGWGFSYSSFDCLKPSITTLRAITVGLGGSLGKDGLKQLAPICPLLESVTLYFQIISDSIMINMLTSLRHLQILALCYCLGEISSLSFQLSMPNLRKLRLERVTRLMTNDDLVVLTRNCSGLIELSLLGCILLNPESQEIISSGWPALTSIHLEDCGKVTADGVAALFNCRTLEDLLLRHNGNGIQRSFILDAASKLPMLRKVSLDLCDAKDGDFDIPEFADRYFLSIVKIARCKLRRCSLGFQKLEAQRTQMHKETLVMVWDSKNLTRTLVKERV